MADNENFNQKIITAVAEKEQWFNNTELPKAQDNYRLHLSCVRNLFEALVRRGLINPDPYKKDKKVTSIVLPDTEQFIDTDRASVIGLRLSDYESVIDYICNYSRFTVDQFNMDKIKKLLELNNVFAWTNLSPSSTKSNTRCLFMLINELRNGAPQLTLSLIKDSMTKTQVAISEINETLKKLATFIREKYKAGIREKILENEGFDKEKAYASTGAFITEVKRLFPTCMGRKSFVNELVTELAQEELATNKDEIRNTLLKSLEIKEEAALVQENKIDVHEILLDALRILGSTADQYAVVIEKIEANHQLIQSSHNSLKDKILRFIRRLFNMDEPVTDYEVQIVDKRTDTKKHETVHFNEFVNSLRKRTANYAAFATKTSPGYQKLSAQKDTVILDYLNKQSVENNHIFAILTGLDELFKQEVKPTERSKIRGISMELTSIKNILVKSNSVRAEYASYVEEQEQMKKLGV